MKSPYKKVCCILWFTVNTFAAYVESAGTLKTIRFFILRNSKTQMPAAVLFHVPSLQPPLCADNGSGQTSL